MPDAPKLGDYLRLDAIVQTDRYRGGERGEWEAREPERLCGMLWRERQCEDDELKRKTLRMDPDRSLPGRVGNASTRLYGSPWGALSPLGASLKLGKSSTRAGRNSPWPLLSQT